MTRLICAAMGIVLLMAGTARADVIVPNSAAGVDADGTFALTSTAAAGRTFQLSIAAGQLSGLVGQEITGLQWRLNGTVAAAWPTVDTSYTFWDVFIGPGVAPALMSNTFAANFTGPVTQVRSGPHTFPANSFSNGSSPNAFGTALNFSTPFLYTGGDLTIEMRFSGQTGATNQPTLDAVLASGGPANGWGVDFAARWTSNAAGVTGGNGNFLVTNLITVPEPSSMALVGVSLASIAFIKKLRQRRRQGGLNP
jgi:hypothetical protein